MKEASIAQKNLNIPFWRISGACAVASFALLPISTTLTDVFLVLSILFMLCAGNIKQRIQQILTNKIARLFLVFFGLYVLGAFYSVAPTHDILKTLTKNSKLLYGALLIPIFVNEKCRKHSLNMLLITLTGIMILSYLKAFGVLHLTPRYEDAAVFKSHIQTNFLMAFYCYLLAMKIIDDQPRKLLWSVLFFLAAFKTLLFSEGRSGYVVFAVLMLLFGWQRFSLKGLLVALFSVSLLCGSAFLFSKNFQTRFNKAITDTHLYQQGNAKTSIGLRISFYNNAIKLISQRPFFGSGTGSLITRYQEVQQNKNLQTHNVHNEYLNVTIQLGLVGFTFLLFFFSSIYFKSFMLPPTYRDIAQATLIAIAVGCLFNSWLMDTMQGHFFAMMMALSMGSPPTRPD